MWLNGLSLLTILIVAAKCSEAELSIEAVFQGEWILLFNQVYSGGLHTWNPIFIMPSRCITISFSSVDVKGEKKIKIILENLSTMEMLWIFYEAFVARTHRTVYFCLLNYTRQLFLVIRFFFLFGSINRDIIYTKMIYLLCSYARDSVKWNFFLSSSHKDKTLNDLNTPHELLIHFLSSLTLVFISSLIIHHLEKMKSLATL